MIKPKAYLAGPIRGIEDYKWRHDFAQRYKGRIDCLVPGDIATSDLDKLKEFRPVSFLTFRLDLDLIDRSDLIVMNLLPHEEGYPARGSLFELGYARAKAKMIILVAGPETGKHPFIAFGADAVYRDFDTMEVFLNNYLMVLNGGCPWFDEIEKGELNGIH